MITPAISVLSAVEGLEVATPAFDSIVVPIAVRHPDRPVRRPAPRHRRGRQVFGPVMMRLVRDASALLGLPPDRPRARACCGRSTRSTASHLFQSQPLTAFLALGAVFLVVTGGEALYADMGHFGRRPIRLAWYCLVLPCLLLNYFGQAALLIRDPEDDRATRSSTWPRTVLLIPLVILATMAAVIASQALISGAFSLTARPCSSTTCRASTIRHTSREHAGPDLRAAGQLGADGRLRSAWCSASALEQPRRGLRHRGHLHDGDHHAALLRRRPHEVELADVEGAGSSSSRCWSSTSRSSRPTSSRSPTAAGSRCSSAPA